MTVTSDSIILHNYPQSPVAEKVRVALGIKGLSWYDVEIPRLPPKPLLTTLSGGYRRTPVMQIGADIYCDSLCILNELDARYPTPAFMPAGNPGLLWSASRLLDTSVFDTAVKVVLGSAGSELPQDFAEDRGRLYLGPDWAAGLARANRELPHLLAQLREIFNGFEQQLAETQAFLTGNAPAAIDARLYHIVWFVAGRWEGGPELMKQFPNIDQWRQQVQSIGHGNQTELPAETAVEVAKAATSTCNAYINGADPQALQVGEAVSISPDTEGGEQPVAGQLRMIDTTRVALDRESEDAGSVCVHFPRIGYRISRIT